MKPVKMHAAAAAAIATSIAMFLTGCMDRPYEAGPPPPSTTVGTKIDDTVITAQVKAALVADPDTRGFEVKVDTRKGQVQLSGLVDNQMQIDKSVAIARGIDGVTEVENKIGLKEPSVSVGNKIDDGIITARVRSALLADPLVKSLDIGIATSKGEVQLSGHVDNVTQVGRAIEVAKRIEGVENVSNEMSVKQ